MRRGEVYGRHDPHFHKPRFRRLVQILKEVRSTPLGSLVRYSEETWDKSDGRFTDAFPYIEISGVGLGTNEYEVSEALITEAPSRARQVVRTDDILVSLTRPHRGAVAHVLPKHDGAIASTGFAVVRDVDSARIDREYLSMCLTASFGCDQMLMRSSGGNYPAITKDELSQVLIPSISLESQRRLTTVIDAARAERKAKLAEADALLAGIDGFLLDALGMAAPVDDGRRVFAVQGQAAANRFDPHFHSPDFARIEAMLAQVRCAPLGNIGMLSRETWRLQDHEDPTFRYIEISTVSPLTGEAYWNDVPTSEVPSRARMQIRADDIIISLTRPHHGSIAHLGPEFDGCIASTGFAVIRSVVEHVSREYLWCVLRAKFCLHPNPPKR